MDLSFRGMKMEKGRKGILENGFMEGVWTSWNKTGQKEQEGIQNGLKDGRWMSWNADGKEEGMINTTL